MDWNQTVLSAIQLESYSDVIFNKEVTTYQLLWSWWRHCSSNIYTRRKLHLVHLYNGHKRVQGSRLQSVVVPNGLIAHLYGPVCKPLYGQFQVAWQFKIGNVLIGPFRNFHTNIFFFWKATSLESNLWWVSSLSFLMFYSIKAIINFLVFDCLYLLRCCATGNVRR